MSAEVAYFALRVIFTCALLLALLLIVRATLRDIAISGIDASESIDAPVATASILIVDPGGAHQPGGTLIPFRGKVQVGRHPQNQIVLDDVSVSSQHATILFDGINWVVSDLASRNGTTVNGQAIFEPVPVRNGDFLAFGRVETRFVC